MRKLSIILSTVAVVVVCVFVFMLPKSEPPIDEAALSVTTTTYPLQFFASQLIDGVDASATSVIPAGTEPHDYEPSPVDVVDLLAADVVFAHGSGIDDWVRDVDLDRVFFVEDGVALVDGDPHVWLDPMYAQTLVLWMLESLRAADPVNADAYQTNADRLNTKLYTLHTQFQNGFAQCERREIVTAHDAFGYLARRYTFTAHAIAGISPEEEPSAASLAGLVDLMRERGLTTVFFEELVSDELAKTLADEVGASTAVLSPIEGALEGEDYFTLMQKNLEALRHAMVCE